MDSSDLRRFQLAQVYFRLPQNQRTQDKEVAEAGSWLEELCILLIGRQVRAKRKKWSHCEEDDRINQVWVYLLRKLPRLRYDPARGSLSDWLTKVIDRILVSFARRRRRPWEPLDTADAMPDRDESITIKQAELARELRAALDVLRPDLPGKNVELIELHWLEGRSLQDAAEQLGLTDNEAKCRQRRTLRKLRQLLPLHSEWPCLADWIEVHFPEKLENPSGIRDTFESHEAYLGL